MLVAILVVAGGPPAAARILKTRPASTYQELALTLGSGLEYESDGEQTELGYPFLVEYGVTERLTLTAEPGFSSIHAKDGPGSASGFGELETGATWQLVSGRRHRPEISAEGVIKWPTASRPELGSGRIDYSLGAIVSKAFVQVDLDLEAIYTFVGSPPGTHLSNPLECSLAAEWHLLRWLDLEGEVVTSSGGVSFRGQSGSIGGFAGGPATERLGRETEGTLGVAERLAEHLKIEQGMILKSDGSWQAVAAWEWDFGEGR